MCNLYSLRAGPDELRKHYAAASAELGNLEPGSIFPKGLAPVVTMQDGERVLTRKSWGMPSPRFALEGKKVDPGVTNVRNTGSAHWKRWLSPEHRCVVPLTSFSEFNKAEGGDIWFALGEERPLACFAGIYTDGWTSTRKLKDGETTDDLYAFLTTEPNAEVKAVHPKAMPVTLTEPDEIEAWLSAPWAEAKALQRPLPDGALQIVSRGTKKDGAEI